MLDIYELNSLHFRSILSLRFKKNFFILFKASMANLFLRDISTLECNFVPRNLHCFHDSFPSLSLLYSSVLLILTLSSRLVRILGSLFFVSLKASSLVVISLVSSAYCRSMSMCGSCTGCLSSCSKVFAR